VLRVDRRAPRPYVGVGMILVRRNRVPEAIGAFRGAIAVDPKHGPAELELAAALHTVGQPAEAWAAAARAHDLGEDVPAALWQRLAEKLPAAPPLPPPCGDAAGPAIDLDRPDSSSRAYVAQVRERIRAHHVYPRPAVQPLPPIPSYMPQPSLTLSGVFRYRVVSEPDAPPPPPAR